jgi:Mg-chelatase subunit ChlD
MQSTLDAAALMLSKEASGKSDDQLSDKGKELFTAQYGRPDVTNIVIKAKLTSPTAGSFNLKLTGSAKLKTTIVKVLGAETMTIGAMSEVKWGIKRLEVALALDNTLSMAMSGRMAALKPAAHNLIDTLKAAGSKPDDVKIAIVPFNTYVKVGSSYKDQNWFNWTLNSVSKSSWQGCVEDRDQSHDVMDTTPNTSNNATLYPAIQCDVGWLNTNNLASVMPLSTNWTALHGKVDAMLPDGTTNITIGLAWAWHALTANAPLAEASAPQPDLDKVIVLMTDGDNTQNRWTTSSSSINARTQQACDNIKAANVKIYTIRLMDGNETLLRNCATRPDMYYNVEEASQLNAAFGTIAKALANLRIAR